MPETPSNPWAFIGGAAVAVIATLGVIWKAVYDLRASNRKVTSEEGTKLLEILEAGMRTRDAEIRELKADFTRLQDRYDDLHLEYLETRTQKHEAIRLLAASQAREELLKMDLAELQAKYDRLLVRVEELETALAPTLHPETHHAETHHPPEARPEAP